MDFRVLGPLEVRVGDQVIAIRAGLPRKLLAVLVLQLGERVSTDTMVDVLWPVEPPANSLNALQIQVSYVRKCLSVGSGEARVETVGQGYRLVADPQSVDAYRLEAAVSAATAAMDPASRLGVLDSALAEWRGSPMPELANDEFAQPYLQRLQEVRLAALEQRADALLELGRHADAVVDLQGLVVLHPFRERFYTQLMTGLYRCGRQAEALSVFERARQTLVEELGLDPGPELQAMEHAVLTHSPDLQPVGLAVGTRTSGPESEANGVRPSSPYPRPLEELIGREPEVSKLRELMASRRLITLTGPGGAGKSRLAAELAATASAPVWWVDLSAAIDRQSVVSAVAAVTGVPMRVGDDGSGLALHLADLQGLLVLDTCERVRAEVRQVAESLLVAAGALSLLATSRQPLGASTELVWPVPPLSLPHPDHEDVREVEQSAAVQLFVDRAASRLPTFELTEDNCFDVAHVCLLLDGLPLAIELAAAHVAALPPARMLSVLDDRLRLLVDDTREDRQHALRSTIAWSHDLLLEEESAFFERLSVFAGPFPLEGAIAVGGAGLPRDGLELLLALVRQSLVAVEADGRYRLLDTIRAFAWERLTASSTQTRDARRRHAEWYADLLDEAAPTGGGNAVEGWRGELRGSMGDLRKALTWCFSSGEDDLGARLLASLWWLWPREGIFEEASGWFASAKAAIPPDSELRAPLLASAGTFAVSRGDLATAAEDCKEAATMFERSGDERGLARVLVAWGIALWGQGDHHSAGRVHDRAAALFSAQGDGWGSALSLVLRARTSLDAGDPDADERLLEAEQAARDCGDRHVLAAALVQRARSELRRGTYEAAEAHAAESLRLNDQHGHREGSVGSLHALGLAWVGQGQVERAGRAFVRALTTAVSMHHSGATAESLDGLAIVAARQRRWSDAARLLTAANDARTRTGIRRYGLVDDLVTEVEAALETAMDRAELARARQDGQVVDLLQLATEQQTRLTT